MTSQLTPEHTTSISSKVGETNERIFLQPWFWVSVLGVIGMVLVTMFT